MAAALLLLPAVAAMYIRAEEANTFTGFSDAPKETDAPSATSSPTASPTPTEKSHKDGYRTFTIVLWSIGFAIMLASAGVLVWSIMRRRRSRGDPYADTPLPTLDSSGRWGFTGSAPKDRDGRGKWNRLDDESEPLTADLSSPEGSPMVGKRGLYEDEDRKP